MGALQGGGEELKGDEEALNENALRSEGEALKGNINTLLSHFTSFCYPLCVFIDKRLFVAISLP